MKRLFHLLAFLSVFSALRAQDTWMLEIRSNVELRTLKLTNKAEQNTKPLKGATIALYQGSSVVKQVSSDASGDFSMMVPPDGEFVIVVSYPNCNPKRFFVSTKGVPADYDREGWEPEFPIGGVIMAKPLYSINYGALQQPMAKISFKVRGKVFDDDEEYTDQVLNSLKQIKSDEDVLIARFLEAVQAGDAALKKPDCPLAKMMYEKALGLIPNEEYPVAQLAKVGECLREKEKQDLALAEKAAKQKELEDKKKREQEERVNREREEAERVAREKAEAAARKKAEEEQMAKARAEAEEKARREQEIQLAAKNAEAARKKAEEEKAASEKAAQEKLAAEKAESEAKQKAADEKLAREKAENEAREKEAKEKLAREKAESETRQKLAGEKLAREKEESAAREKEAREKLAREKAEAAAQEKAAADKVAKEKQQEGERQKAAAEKLAAEKAAPETKENEKEIRPGTKVQAVSAAGQSGSDPIKNSDKSNSKETPVSESESAVNTQKATGSATQNPVAKAAERSPSSPIIARENSGSPGEPNDGRVKSRKSRHSVRHVLGTSQYEKAVAEADELFLNKDFDKARALYSKALELKPLDAHSTARLDQIKLLQSGKRAE